MTDPLCERVAPILPPASSWRLQARQPVRYLTPRVLVAGIIVSLLAAGCAPAVVGGGSGGSPAVATRALVDTSLVARILMAEDRRDSTDSALVVGATHADERVRRLAVRALGRIRDPKFVARDAAPALAEPPAWPEPAWRQRHRALAARRDDCGALQAAAADSAWPVRLRAADLSGASCPALAATWRAWVDALPADASRRESGGVSWHAAAHGIVALARVRPVEARVRAVSLARHPQWQVRMYAARAAGILADTALLRALVRDADDNVKEAAIEELARVAPGDVDTFVALLRGTGPQAVRAAAIALKGTPREDIRRAALAALERWIERGNASERDVRVALLEVAGRPASEDRTPPVRYVLPPRAATLALGEDVRLRVRMAEASGGGAFVVRLRGDVAPVMAARILALVNARYYDGLTWHRVEHDFVIQGGSPGASEYVGLAHFLRDELGTVPHRRGTVGMSTRGHDTGDAQWFVNLKDNLRLGPDYTVFAEVVQGIEVVDAVMEGDVIEGIDELRTIVTGLMNEPELPAATRDLLARADAANLAAVRRLATVDVRPDSVMLRVGQSLPLDAVTVAWRDSAGAPLTGFAPATGITGDAARIVDGTRVEAMRPGISELHYRILLMNGPTPPGLPFGRVRVIVAP